VKGKSLAGAALFVVVGGATLPATAQSQYQVAPVSDGGTIKGKVIYKGSVPVKTVLPTKDRETCGGPRKDPLVIVGKGGEVKDAVVRLKDVAKGKDWTKAKAAAIDQKGCIFLPHVMVMQPGNLDILNSDPVLHNTHGYYGKNTAFNVALPIQGAKVTRPLRRPGVVRVDCDAHGWMEGWIVVVDNPYYAQTAADGSFSIDGVPPGKYVLEIWQEHTGATEVPVTVTAKQTLEVPTIELKK
jgi:hypothetical protein